MILNKTFSTINLDKIAVYLSVFCAVQCLLLPISALLLPTLSVVPLADEWFHSLLLFFVIPTSVFAMALGCKKHKSYNIIFYGILGLSILIISAIWGHDLFGESGEIVSTLVGTSILSYGHIQNQKLCKLCCH